MVSTEIRKVRCDDVLSKFCENGSAVFFTLTTPDVVDIVEIRSRWRKLRHYLIANVFPPGVKYVMNYEVHPNGHGWHIHSVFSRYVPLKRILPKLKSFGFGRVDVRKVNSKGVADYLTKHALKAYRGVSRALRESSGDSRRLRLVNTSRGLPRLSDYRYESEYKKGVNDLIRDIRDQSVFPFLNKIPFSILFPLVDSAYFMGYDTLLDFRNFYLYPQRCAEKFLDRLASRKISYHQDNLPLFHVEHSKVKVIDDL